MAIVYAPHQLDPSNSSPGLSLVGCHVPSQCQSSLVEDCEDSCRLLFVGIIWPNGQWGFATCNV